MAAKASISVDGKLETLHQDIASFPVKFVHGGPLSGLPLCHGFCIDRLLHRPWLSNFSHFGGHLWPQRRRFRPMANSRHCTDPSSAISAILVATFGRQDVAFVRWQTRNIASTLAEQFQPFWWPTLAAKASLSFDGKL